MRITSADVTRAPLAATAPEPKAAVGAPPASTFGALLGDAIEQAVTADRTAAEKIAALVSGASDDIHGTMIAAKEAEISLKLVGTIRNRLIEAFHELWRTNV
jgi:flagellar hook-basal body complex protein FliE